MEQLVGCVDNTITSLYMLTIVCMRSIWYTSAEVEVSGTKTAKILWTKTSKGSNYWKTSVCEHVWKQSCLCNRYLSFSEFTATVLSMLCSRFKVKLTQMLALDTEWGRCGQVWRMKVINDKLTKGGWKSMKKNKLQRLRRTRVVQQNNLSVQKPIN